MSIATCGLTAAVFGRLIPATAPDEWIYAGVDALILLSVGRDLIAARSASIRRVTSLPTVSGTSGVLRALSEFIGSET